MGIFGSKNIIKIAEEDLNDARLSSVDFDDEQTRKRAFINVLSARLAMKLLFSKKIEAGNYYSMYTIRNVLNNVDIADIYFGNIKIDVRLVFNEDEIFVPKKQIEYNIQPDLYLTLILKEDMSSAELLGFFEPSQLDKSNQNADFYFFEKENLQKPDNLKKFLSGYKVENKLGSSEADLEKAESLIVSSVDNEIKSKDLSFLLQQLSSNIELRGKFVEFENFELLSTKAALAESLHRDNVLGIVGTQNIAEEDEDNLELETILFNNENEDNDISGKTENADNAKQNSFAEALAVGATEGAVIAGGVALAGAAIAANATGTAGIAAAAQGASTLEAVSNGVSGLADMTGKIVDLGHTKAPGFEFKDIKQEELNTDEFALDDLINEIETESLNDNTETEEEFNIDDLLSTTEEETTTDLESTAFGELNLEEFESEANAEENFNIDDLISTEDEETIDLESTEFGDLDLNEIESEVSEQTETVTESDDANTDFSLDDLLSEDSELQNLINESEELTAENTVGDVELEELPTEELNIQPEAIDVEAEENIKLDDLIPAEESIPEINFETEDKKDEAGELKFEELSELPQLDELPLFNMPDYIEGLSESANSNELDTLNELPTVIDESTNTNDVVDLKDFDFKMLEEEDDEDFKKTEPIEESNDSLQSFDSLLIDESDETKPIEDINTEYPEEPEITNFKSEEKDEENIDLSQLTAEVDMLLQQADIAELNTQVGIDGDTSKETEDIGNLDDLTAQIDELLNESNEQTNESVTEDLFVQPSKKSDESSSELNDVNDELKNLFKDEKQEKFESIGNIGDISEDDLMELPAYSAAEQRNKKRIIIAASVAGVMLVSIVAGGTLLKGKNGTPTVPTGANAPISADVQQTDMGTASTDTNAISDPTAMQPDATQPGAMQNGMDQPQQYSPQPNRDMGQAVSDAFTSEPVNASVSKIAWEVPEELAYNDVFRKYLQTAGKNIKLTLQNDLLLSTELAYSNKMVVDIKLSRDGSVQSTNIIVSSGSKQIDKIVLQSVNETLKYLKAPSSELSSQSATATLIINF